MRDFSIANLAACPSGANGDKHNCKMRHGPILLQELDFTKLVRKHGGKNINDKFIVKMGRPVFSRIRLSQVDTLQHFEFRSGSNPAPVMGEDVFLSKVMLSVMERALIRSRKDCS